MNREHKFRGKRKDNGEWVYGNLVIDSDGGTNYIVERAYWNCQESNDQTLYYEVVSETVGEYTGLRDNKRTEEFPNGQGIYENDLVMLDGCNFDFARIVWFDGRLELRINDNRISWKLDSTAIRGHNIKVAGNIFDNEELLEVL